MPVTKACEVCGTVFKSSPSAERKLCGRKCAGKHLSSLPKVSRDWIRIRHAWQGMKRRTLDTESAGYSYYGGRGISVCKEWLESFESFHEWAIANGYAPSLELDRKNCDGNYEPENCRWATRTQQMQNTRSRRGSASRFKGVSLHSQNGRWRAQIVVDGLHKSLGCFETEESAAAAYDAAATEFFGEFAVLNLSRKVCALS